ncbi:MAG: hypothetical protein HKN41_04940 [Ilumatobacter sp.]|nr:hypothetical protein [Ilumatobacter sp.]
MNVFLAFIFGVIAFTIWESHGGPRWRAPVVVLGCFVLAVGFTSLRVI